MQCMRRRLLNCVMVFVHYICTYFLTDILGVRVYILDLDVPYSKSRSIAVQGVRVLRMVVIGDHTFQWLSSIWNSCWFWMYLTLWVMSNATRVDCVPVGITIHIFSIINNNTCKSKQTSCSVCLVLASTCFNLHLCFSF